MRKKSILCRAAAFICVAPLLIIQACTAQPANETTAAQQSGAETDGRGENLRMLTEKLKNIGGADAGTVEECVKLYDALSDEEKVQIPYDYAVNLFDAEYRLAGADILENREEHFHEIVQAVALAYYDQCYLTRISENNAPTLLYDQYNYRRNFNPNPEDATAGKNLYLDCSSFVNAVYYYCFGQNLLPEGTRVATKNLRDNLATKPEGEDREVLVYLDADEAAALRKDPAAAKAFFDHLKEILQPGDLLNYYRADTGHAVMYLGDGKFIHCTGTANAKTTNGTVSPVTSIEKNTADEARFGAINIDDWDVFFTATVKPKDAGDGRVSTSNKYLLADNITSVAFYRPTNPEYGRFRELEISDRAVARLLYEGMIIEKTAKVSRGGVSTPLYYSQNLYAGDEITYSVKIKNISDRELNAVSLTEKIPAGAGIAAVSSGAVMYKAEGSVLAHVGKIAPGKSVTVSYTIMIPDGTAPGKIIDDGDTFVCSIRTNRLINQVSAPLDAGALSAALDTVLGEKFDDSLKAIQAVYLKAAGEGKFARLASLSGTEQAYSLLFESNRPQNGSLSGKMLVSTLFGGYNVNNTVLGDSIKKSTYNAFNSSVRRVTPAQLEDGDIILTYSKFLAKTECRLYADGVFYSVGDDGVFAKDRLADLSSAATVQGYLDTLTAYNAFAVLRPSLAE